MRRIAALLPFLLAAACGRPAPPPAADPEWLAGLEAWRRTRAERLAAADGWLTLIALVWLEPGRYGVGSAPGAAVRLPDPDLPPEAAVLEVDREGRVTIRASAGEPVLVNGSAVDGAVLEPDVPGPPTLVRVGRFTLHIIRRGDRLGVRVKDPEAPTRTGFAGLDWYPPDPVYRVTAHLVRFPSPRQVRVSTVVGTEEVLLAPGELRFSLRGRELTLLPLVEHPEDRELFIVFRDRTSGVTTYGAGRFLDATLSPGGDRVVLDFNRAYSPPCAFTPYATCPLPPPENELPVAVEAGERTPPGHHRPAR